MASSSSSHSSESPNGENTKKQDSLNRETDIAILSGYQAQSIQAAIQSWQTEFNRKGQEAPTIRYTDWGPNPVHTITSVDWSSTSLFCLAGPLDAACLEALQRCLKACDPKPQLILHAGKANQPYQQIADLCVYYSPEPLKESELLELIHVFSQQNRNSTHPLSREQQHQAQRLTERVENADDWYQALASLQITLQSLLGNIDSDIVLWGAEDEQAAFAENILFSGQHAGICAYVRSTGQAQNLPHVSQDSRYIPEFDLPASTFKYIASTENPYHESTAGQGSMLILPLLAQSQGPGVIRFYRAHNQPAFTEQQQHLLQLFLAAVSDALQRQWLLHARPAENRLGTDSPALNNPIYRQEALQHFVQGDSDEAGVLIEDDQLGKWTYWVLLAGLLSLVAYLFMGTVHEYAAGPALIRASGRTELTAIANGTVNQLLAQPGTQVSTGQALISLYHGREQAELQRLQQEFDARLRQRLLNPDDIQVEAALINLRSELELARSRLAERTITAPRDGIVGDIRVRQGQYVVSGQSLMNLTHSGESRELIALIPGRFRPQLNAGMSLRMELSGYPYDYQHLNITSVDEQVTGPQQARLYLGAAISDALTIEGPVVMVHAELPATFATRAGDQYVYHDGMSGTVEIRLRSESIIERLMPGIKLLKEEHE